MDGRVIIKLELVTLQPTVYACFLRSLDEYALNAYNTSKIGVGEMKRRDLIKKLENSGWWLAREGSNHTIYTNGKQSLPIPRHKEINEITAMKILKKAELKQAPP